jgi:hypothetical protein
VAKVHDEHDQNPIVNGVDNAVVTDAKAIQATVTGEGFDASRTGRSGEACDRCNDPCLDWLIELSD